LSLCGQRQAPFALCGLARALSFTGHPVVKAIGQSKLSLK
jgi:hypothetical protein